MAIVPRTNILDHIGPALVVNMWGYFILNLWLSDAHYRLVTHVLSALYSELCTLLPFELMMIWPKSFPHKLTFDVAQGNATHICIPATKRICRCPYLMMLYGFKKHSWIPRTWLIPILCKWQRYRQEWNGVHNRIGLKSPISLSLHFLGNNGIDGCIRTHHFLSIVAVL